MSEDYSTWSNEQLLAKFALFSHPLGVQEVIVKEQVRAALLARMKPAAVKPEAGRNGNPPDYVVTVDDGYCICKFELNGTRRYSIDNLISFITSNTELHVANIKELYPAPLIPETETSVPAQEPPAEKREEWEEVELGDKEIVLPGDNYVGSYGKYYTLTDNCISVKLKRTVAEVKTKDHGVISITRRVRKQPPAPADHFVCPDCGAEMNVREVKIQPDTAAALEVAWTSCAMHALTICRNAIAEIDRLEVKRCEMKPKFVAVINGKEYKVGYPKCQGCEHLCFPGPLTCDYPGKGCEYPELRIRSEEIQNDHPQNDPA
ncbi:MAG: hypothetical protein WC998_01640 [Candidatus Paceibacterota bacterium]